jgi:hypothetical protein
MQVLCAGAFQNHFPVDQIPPEVNILRYITFNLSKFVPHIVQVSPLSEVNVWGVA